jgi:phosphoribosylaminoimidazole-succinocarboxamide synthase
MTTSDLPLQRVGRGKVRDVYTVDAELLLLVATDRVSAFDVVMGQAVPHKGVILTQISAWWFHKLKAVTPHHMLTANPDEIIAAVPDLKAHRRAISGRAMLCRKTIVFPIECVIRGYLSGSAWSEYAASGTLAGEPLAAGLRESARLALPLFSPATKVGTGHDENITVAHMCRIVGSEVAGELEQRSRAIYAHGEAAAAERGIIIADTKFEFGRGADGRILLIDEVLTPDSSRFWPAESYAPGRRQPSFDKQPLRDYLDGERRAGRWNGEAPPPRLPPEIVDATSKRYFETFRRLTGTALDLDALA